MAAAVFHGNACRLFLVLVFPMLTFGAVDFEPLAVITMVVAVSAAIMCWRPFPYPRVSFIAGWRLFASSFSR